MDNPRTPSAWRRRWPDALADAPDRTLLLAGDVDRDLIVARRQRWPRATAAEAAPPLRLLSARAGAHVPEHAIQSRLRRALERRDLIALDVGHGDARAGVVLGAQVVIDRQRVRLVRHFDVGAAEEVIVSLRAEPVRRARLDSEEVQRFGQHVGRELLQMSDVADEDPAAVGAEHEIALARV